MEYYALQYTPVSDQSEPSNIGEDSSDVAQFHNEFVQWGNGTENRAYISFADIMTYRFNEDMTVGKLSVQHNWKNFYFSWFSLNFISF